MALLKKTFPSVLLVIILTSHLFAQRETVDKIVAVVGNEVILASELIGQLQLIALQTGQQPRDEEELVQFQKNILEQMISDRLFLIAAREDTTISVRSEEIDDALDKEVSRIAQNFNSYDDFLTTIAREGLTIRELKKKYRVEVENQLLKQRYIQRKLYSVSVSKREVEEFYYKFKDSIPIQPEGVKLAQILLTFQPSQKVEDSVRQLAQDLRQRILDGANFADISSKYSSPEAGVNGGDLGYVSPDDVVPEFRRASFNLSIGDISEVIRTQFGYHVIRCEGKKGDRLKLRHLLLVVSPTKEDSMITYQLADSLLNAIRQGDDFQQLAKSFSADDNTRAQGGEIGWLAISQLPVEFKSAVSGWNNPGECRGPIASRNGLHILKLLDYQPEREFTLENGFDRIKELARQDKTGKLVDKWTLEMKDKTYISYRLD